MISSNSPRAADDLAVDPFGSPDARALLLTEVDFKWLMAGQGWWVNTPRFHADPAYAAKLVGLALASSCVALRDCARSLRAQLDHHRTGDPKRA